MKRMRKCNDEIYQLAKDQALVKKLKNKRRLYICITKTALLFVTRKSSILTVILFTVYIHVGIFCKF